MLFVIGWYEMWFNCNRKIVTSVHRNEVTPDPKASKVVTFSSRTQNNRSRHSSVFVFFLTNTESQEGEEIQYMWALFLQLYTAASALMHALHKPFSYQGVNRRDQMFWHIWDISNYCPVAPLYYGKFSSDYRAADFALRWQKNNKDEIMDLFLQVFARSSSTVHEEWMLAISTQAGATGP